MPWNHSGHQSIALAQPSPATTAATAPNPPIDAQATVPTPPMEDFGRDQTLKFFPKSLQPKVFTGEGVDIPCGLEERIISMEDYFALVGYNVVAQGIMGRAKLDVSAKMWWKLNCQSCNVTKTSQGSEKLKFWLKECYLPLNNENTKMNEFLSCARRGRATDL